MLLVGNDVVDLTDPEKKGTSRNVRFTGRVFTPAEQGWIRGSVDPDGTLWTLWAAKEAAFKVVRKFQPSVCSIPRSYPVDPNPSGRQPSGEEMVITPEGGVHVRWRRDGETIHAIAVSQQDREDSVVWGLERFDGVNGPGVDEAAGPSLLGRRALTQRLSEVLGCCPSALEVRRFKEPRGLGPPRLYIHGLPAAIDISLSHDGRWVAYAFTRS